MPQANVWIKQENWDYWQNIPDKSAFINSMIHHYGIGSNSSDSNPYTHAAVETVKQNLQDKNTTKLRTADFNKEDQRRLVKTKMELDNKNTKATTYDEPISVPYNF